jgi:hypothetical protein
MIVGLESKTKATEMRRTPEQRSLDSREHPLVLGATQSRDSLYRPRMLFALTLIRRAPYSAAVLTGASSSAANASKYRR